MAEPRGEPWRALLLALNRPRPDQTGGRDPMGALSMILASASDRELRDALAIVETAIAEARRAALAGPAIGHAGRG